MRSFAIRALAIIGAAMLPAACAPVYDTQYTYSAPATAAGQTCISACQADQSGCSYGCRRRAQDCEYEKDRIAEREFNRYVRWRQERGLHVDRTRLYFRPTYSCPRERECRASCDTVYRACFTACGGRIEAREVCVAGCDPP